MNDNYCTKLLKEDINRYIQENDFPLKNKAWKDDLIKNMKLNEYQVKILKNKNFTQTKLKK